VEVPVWASKKGLSPVRVGALPPQCAMLTNLSASVEEMAVEGALSGNPRLVFQAILHDPLTAAVLSMAEIKEMVNCMFEQNKDYLPQFNQFRFNRLTAVRMNGELRNIVRLSGIQANSKEIGRGKQHTPKLPQPGSVRNLHAQPWT
jgi:hypothetical protein